MDETNQSSPIDMNIDKICEELRIRKEIYMRLVKSFANSLQGKMNKLNEALTLNDSDQMRMILHEIKGTAGNLRLHNISQAENVMHVAVKSGESQKMLSQYFTTLNSESEKLVQYISQLSGNES